MRAVQAAWAVIALVAAPLGCISPSSERDEAGGLASAEWEEFLPPRSAESEADAHVRRGVLHLDHGRPAEASREFNGALRLDPASSYLQFLNGLAYHQMALRGDVSQSTNARLGYELALKFDEHNWLAAQQLGHLSLGQGDPVQAQDHFARALLYQPDDGDLLLGLAQSSYLAGDLGTALGAIRQALAVAPDSRRISSAAALIFAACGSSEACAAELERVGVLGETELRLARLRARIADWGRLHADLPADEDAGTQDPPDESEEPQEPEEPEQPDESEEAEGPSRSARAQRSMPDVDRNVASGETPPAAERMVVVDVVMIRTEEIEASTKGVNLLDGLFVQFSGDSNYEETNPTGGLTSITRTLTGNLSIPEVKYAINIFNAAEDRNEIMAQPTLIALDGKESTFFAGSTLNVAVSGIEGGDLESIEAGVHLTLTPTFLEDGSLELSVAASRSFFEAVLTAPGSFDESVRRSDNSVTANVQMEFDQTLVLSGLREKQTIEVKSGVLFLRDIPLIQYLFSNERTIDFHKSIIILLTPRRVTAGLDVSTAEAVRERERKRRQHLEVLREDHEALFLHDDNLDRVLEHVSKHRVYRGLRDGTQFDVKWWGDREEMQTILKRALSFLYY